MEQEKAIFFSEYFGIESNPQKEDDFFDIIVDTDLPVFIDPFLIFCSEKETYNELYANIIEYLRFLSRKSVGDVSKSEFNSYYLFHEVQETHTGFSLRNNPGKGLGEWFGKVLLNNLRKIFLNPNTTHLEKLCLVADGVGKDKISDFSANLIKGFLADYTANISTRIPDQSKVKEFTVRRAYFNYEKNVWIDKKYKLPFYGNKYILLIPKDILTKEDSWINKNDLYESILNDGLPRTDENTEIRFKLNQIIDDDLKKDEKIKIIKDFLKQNPSLIDDYIKFKELHADDVPSLSYKGIVNLSSFISPSKIETFSTIIEDYSPKNPKTSYEEGINLLRFFKDTIENKGVWKEFWINGIDRVDEKSVQNLFKLTWRGSRYNISSEVDNGSGPVDFMISMGSEDITIVEFKLASNSKALPINQVDSYKRASNTNSSLIVVFCFDEKEVLKITRGIQDKGLSNAILINVSKQDSASKL